MSKLLEFRPPQGNLRDSVLCSILDKLEAAIHVAEFGVERKVLAQSDLAPLLLARDKIRKQRRYE